MWRKEFSETGGYDSMFGAWYLYDPSGNVKIVVNLGDYGQEPCDFKFRSPEAEADAAFLVDALNGREEQRRRNR